MTDKLCIPKPGCCYILKAKYGEVSLCVGVSSIKDSSRIILVNTRNYKEDNYVWKYFDDGSFRLKASDDLVIDYPGEPSDWRPLILKMYAKGDISQRWDPVEKFPFIISKENSHYCIDVHNGDFYDGNSLQLYTYNLSPAQMFNYTLVS